MVGEILPTREYLRTPGDIFGCHDWKMKVYVGEGCY